MKKKLTVKTLYLINIFIVILNFNTFSQTFEEHYEDGKIYFKIKDGISTNIPVNEDNTINLDDVSFLNDIRANYNIISLARPFYYFDDYKMLRTYLLEFKNYSDVNNIIEELQKIDIIEYAEKVPLYRISFQPNDPLYLSTANGSNWNWHLDKINAQGAWDISKGSSAIKVAVTDNAIWTSHPDFTGKIVAQKDMADNDNDPNPPYVSTQYDQYLWSHGTHCVGMVGANTNNNTGISSIGYNVSIIAVKMTKDTANPLILNSGLQAIQWAAQSGADVISMSFGYPNYSSTEANYFNLYTSMGIVLVAAAGNEGVSSARYPAGYTSVIAVASTDEDDKKSDFSNYGTWVDICAPGGYSPDGATSSKISVLGSTYCDAYATPGITGKYSMMQGTSMATPLVAGLCGLMLSLDPTLTPAEVKNCLTSKAVNINSLNPSYVGQLGAGRIDARASMQCVQNIGIKKYSNPAFNISLYPNPANDIITIDFTGKSPENASIKIYNTVGKVVLCNQQKGFAPVPIQLDISELSGGVYFVTIETTDNKITRKLTVVK